jgi:hypothetical protein
MYDDTDTCTHVHLSTAKFSYAHCNIYVQSPPFQTLPSFLFNFFLVSKASLLIRCTRSTAYIKLPVQSRHNYHQLPWVTHPTSSSQHAICFESDVSLLRDKYVHASGKHFHPTCFWKISSYLSQPWNFTISTSTQSSLSSTSTTISPVPNSM